MLKTFICKKNVTFLIKLCHNSIEEFKTKPMKIDNFVNTYSEEFVITFLSEDQPEKTVLAKISSFLFEPVYEIDNLKFKLVS